MINDFLIILTELVFVSLLILVLFRQREKLGLAPLFILLGAIQYFQTVLARSFNVNLFSDYTFSPGSIILFSSTLFAVLLVYIKEGVTSTRTLIYGIVIANLSIGILSGITTWQLNSMNNIITVTADSTRSLKLNLRILLVGSLALFLDFFLTVIVFKYFITKIKKLGLFPIILVTLLIVLGFDSVLFITGSFYERPAFGNMLASQLIGKSIAGVFFSITLYLYIKYFDSNKTVGSKFIADRSEEILSIITYREKAEAKLAEKEQQLKLFVEFSPAAVAMLDMDMKYIIASKRWSEDYQLGDIDLTGKSHYDIFPGIPQDWKKVHQRCLAGAIEKMEEDKFVRADGRTDWVRWEIHPWFNYTGEVGGIILLTEVITERKKAEQALEESERKFRALTSNAPVGIFQTDSKGECNYVNEEWLKYAGMEFEEAMGNGWLKAIHPEDKDKVLIEWGESLSSGKNFNSEFRFLDKKGKTTWLSVKAVELSDKNHKVIGYIGMDSDITNRKIAELELLQIKESLEIAEGIAGLGSWEFELATQKANWSKELFRIFGFEPGTKPPTLQAMLERIHTGDREIVKKGITMIRQGIMPDPVIFRTNPDLGSLRYLQPTWETEKDDTCHVFKIFGTILDITNRVLYENKIKESEEKYRTLVQQASDGITIADTSLRFIDVNNRFCDMLGYEKEDLLKIKMPDLVLHESTDKPLQFKNIKSESSTLTERKLKRKDGAIVPVEISSTLTPNGNFLSIVRNISDRKKAEEQIYKERELSDSVINSLPGIFYLFDANKKILRWNKNFGEVLGYADEEILTIQPVDFFEGEGRKLVQENFAKTLSNGKAAFEANLVSKKGDFIPYYFTGLLVHYNGQPCLIGVGIDITERKKAEGLLEKSHDDIRQLVSHLDLVREEERKRIGQEIHDDLGQQLTAIKMDVAWVNKKMPDTDKQIKKKLENIIGLLDGSNHSVRRILNELKPSILDEYGLLDALEWHGKQFTENTGIPVVFNRPESAIRLDEKISTCIFRVYQESLTNIARHAGAKNIIVSLEIIKDSIIVAIEDDGKGFDKASVKDKVSFGILGMKERVLSLKGKFELQSFINRGTTIVITLPCRA